MAASPIKRRKHITIQVHQPAENAIDNDPYLLDHAAVNDGKAESKISSRKLPPPIFFVVLAVLYTSQFYTSQYVHHTHSEPLTLSSIPKDSQLIGQYTIDEQYLYWSNHDASAEGRIYFPSADLTTQIVEDATNTTLRQNLVGDNTEDIFHDIVPNLEHTDHFHALLTLKGYKGATPNQDRSIIVKFFVNDTTTFGERKTNATKPNEQATVQETLLLGIFDGHGERGHEVSQHVALELPKIFARTIKEQQKLLLEKESNSTSDSISPMDARYIDLVREAMTATFLEVDDTEPVKGTGTSGGSTASTLFYPGFGSKLYLANVGDSVTIIARYDKTTNTAAIVKQNRKDKPHLDEERKRIEAVGGKVSMPFALPSANDYGPQGSSRLIITLPGGFQIGLAMSRSIGDAEGKRFGLIAEPTVEVFDVQEYYMQNAFSEKQIDDYEWFSVIASDGVYDVLSPEKVVQRLGESLYSNTKDTSVGSTCEKVIREAGRLWMKHTIERIGEVYRDDITLGVSNIKLQY